MTGEEMQDIEFDQLTAFVSQYYLKDNSNTLLRVNEENLWRSPIDTRGIPSPGQRDRLEALIAVDQAYAPSINTLVSRLEYGYPVLQVCDKTLNIPLAEWVKADPRLKNFHFEHVTATGKAGGQVLEDLLADLRHKLSSPGDSLILIIDHLDLMTTSLEGSALRIANDIVYWLSEYRQVPVLAFADPSVELPKLVEDIFAEKHILPPFSRTRLYQLLRPEEAQCIACDRLTIADQLCLYQYVSGLNAVQMRRMLRMITNPASGVYPLNPPGALTPPDPERVKKQVSQIYATIRKMTTTGEVQVPVVNEKDIVGYEETKKDLTKRVIFPFEKRFRAATAEDLAQSDAMVPKGVILYGPPRNGKTEFAKWLANIIQAPLHVVRGPELKNKLVGETEREIRRTFALARKTAPSIILIDEIDALTPTRDTTSSGVDLSMVAMFLTEMDGLSKDEAVLVIGTTNRLDAVDPAFKAPGRFGVLIPVGYPSEPDRLEILRHYAAQMHLQLNEKSFKFLQNETRGALDPGEERRRKNLYSALLATTNQELRSAAKGAFEEYLSQQVGLDQVPKWSCDHLRGICQAILIEMEWAARQIPRQELEINNEEFLRRILNSVRQGAAGGASPQLRSSLLAGFRGPRGG